MATALSLIALALAGVALGVALAGRERARSIRRRHERLVRRVALGESVARSLFEDRVRRDLESEGRPPRFPVRFRSQHGEDMLLYELFEGRPSGFFVEVGAYDGFSHAVTYALEAIGWEGLLVEAIPERAAQASRCRPASRVVHAALGGAGSSGTVTLTRFVDEGTSELSSYVNSIGGEVDRPRRATEERVEVPLTSMDALLTDHEGAIDLAVVDVEGGEPEVFAGFDLERFRPRVLLVEDHTRNDDSAIGRSLRARGYRDAAWISFNRLMVHESEQALLLRARALAYSTDSGRMPPEPVPDNRPSPAVS